MTDHVKAVGEAKAALVAAIAAARTAGYRVDGDSGVAGIGVSETAKVQQPDAGGAGKPAVAAKPPKP